LDDAPRQLIELLQRGRVVDVAVLRLDDDGQDVRAAEHPAEIVVDVDVRMALAEREVVAEHRDMALARIEVEKLRQHPDARALIREEDGHECDGERDRETIPQQEAQVGFDPAPRDHDPPSRSRSASRSRRPSSIRKTRPSAPTAMPRPEGVSHTERIQRAASWMGRGSIAQLLPPSALFSNVPASPAIHPASPRTDTS